VTSDPKPHWQDQGEFAAIAMRRDSYSVPIFWSSSLRLIRYSLLVTRH